MHIEMPIVRDAGCHLLDGLRHDGQGAQPLLHEGGPLPLPHGTKNMITNLVRAIKNDGIWLLDLGIVRGRCIKRLTGDHGILANSQSTGEDGLHLIVVLDGPVEVLTVLGVILRMKDNVVSCDCHVRSSETSGMLAKCDVVF